MKKSILVTLLGLLGMGYAAANQPDSVYLFSYAQPNGEGGLKLAWSSDGAQWTQLNNGASVVNSDFGPWGRMKRMYNPHLTQSATTGQWQCIWDLSKDSDGMAFVTSPDLLKWNPQIYYTRGETPAQAFTNANPTVAMNAMVKGHEYQGWKQKVPYSLIVNIKRYGDHRRYLDGLYAETMSQDDVRFKGLKPVNATIKVFGDSTKAISDELIGIFFEDINYGADGGLYAELIQNRDFEYTPSDRGGDKKWTADYAWTAFDANGQPTAVVIEDAQPLHDNNPHYAVLKEGSLTNAGFDGIPVKKGETYKFSIFTNGVGSLTAELVGDNGEVLASAKVKANTKNWKKQQFKLIAKDSAKNATFRLKHDKGYVNVDMVSLFPSDTFKGRENGLRKDLAQTLADLNPRFVRFPGGCVAHGDGVDNIYDWKGSIGPLEARKPLRNLWNYHQTRGLGYHEYFLFCEDLGAEPLPVLAAGVPCQNSGVPSHHSHNEVTRYGQQGGIPMDEMDQYVQDVLDLIEYANGNPKTNKWAAMRAKAGHPKPFNMKYIGIGNEDLITEDFEVRFKMITDAVKAKYPEITVVGTVGPFYEGTDYERGWEFATEQNVPIVDEHYYVSPGWLIHNNDYYDNYDRSKPKVYLGEYASHMAGRPNNLETALSVALYLTGVERNADVVVLSSYAPLLCKEGHVNWAPDLIFFNNHEVKPTVDYYVQQLYGQNSGTEYVNSAMNLDNHNPDVKCRVGVSVVKDEKTGEYIVKLANLLPQPVNATVDLSTIGVHAKKAVKTVLSGNPADKNVRPEVSEIELSDNLAQQLPPYSFTVIRF